MAVTRGSAESVADLPKRPFRLVTELRPRTFATRAWQCARRPSPTTPRLKSDGNAAPLIEISQTALADHLATSGQRTYWLTLDESVVTAICQQYRP
jgi:hypothetical protein